MKANAQAIDNAIGPGDIGMLAATLIVGGILALVFVLIFVNLVPSVAFGVTQAQANTSVDTTSDAVLGTFPLLFLVIGIVGVVAFVFVALNWMSKA